jgi:hypothetical protein
MVAGAVVEVGEVGVSVCWVLRRRTRIGIERKRNG